MEGLKVIVGGFIAVGQGEPELGDLIEKFSKEGKVLTYNHPDSEDYALSKLVGADVGLLFNLNAVWNRLSEVGIPQEAYVTSNICNDYVLINKRKLPNEE